MNNKPAFFEPIRQRAAQRWNQLEQDPELAGPWHQLFKQVQSPRHILSELLQNADDAGATGASVQIENGFFEFTHNGEDFTEEHFASLCRFGYSNKRVLHTIGFRGIGFKSTFSLGDIVELYTPTLSVSFDRQRFTEPKWVVPTGSAESCTRIRVAIRDEHRQREVEKNLEEWLKSPVSLLFFKHIRRLRIGNQELHWGSHGLGPVPNTEWMALHDNPDKKFLIVRSKPETFPPEALTEIKQERLLGADQDVEFPPCIVEIVLGAKGRLYVVLPTGVETTLPFASNAPFIQDPARLKIKDPEISPTNRWLLQRIGSLAGSTMIRWLEQTPLSIAERSRAYDLFPDVDRDDNSLEGTCAVTVEEAFGAAIESNAFLLTNVGELKAANESISIPEELVDVWPDEQAAALLDDAGRTAFSRHVSAGNLKKLVHWGVIEEISKKDILNVLQTKHLPKPKTWRRLLKLWVYVAPEIIGYYHHLRKEQVRIVPVQGKDVLYSASEVVRLGEKRLLQSEADWGFLAEHLLVLNQNWSRYLAEQRRNTEDNTTEGSKEDIEMAFAVQHAISLEEVSDVSKVLEQVSVNFFNQKSITLSGCIQIAQIAAKLGATVGESFHFVTQDKKLRATDSVILFDKDCTLERLFPEGWCYEHLLHRDYTKSFDSCTSEEWARWIASGRARLLAFTPLVQREKNIWGRSKIEAEIRRRGCESTIWYPYVGQTFIIEDWDFDESHWGHWTSLAKDNPKLWGELIDRILALPEGWWSKAKGARIVQVATTGTRKAITLNEHLPAWILKLRELPCLSDTRGFYHKPAELLRRTPETESLMDVEPFIHGRLDTEATRPLLKMLGVHDTPTGPDHLLDRLRALAMSDNPPVHEIEKWYRRLDQMADTCSTVDFASIKKALCEEKIILTEGAGWAKAPGVFLSSDEEDVPGAAVIRASVSDLSLWRKIGIAERPTADLAIKWLKELPSGRALPQDEARRVRALLSRHAARIWNECRHWLNLAGEWVPVDTLSYALTMQSLIPWNHLHEWVKKKTADLQRLSSDITEALPFSDLPHLASHIEDRFHRTPHLAGLSERKPWLNQFGAELSRVELDDDAEIARIRTLAAKLEETEWRTTPELEIVPYIDGTPAGTPKRVDVVWLDKTLYVDNLSNAKLARLVPDRLGKEFRRPDVTAALNYCFGRSPVDVTEYLEENFKLAPREKVVSPEVLQPSFSGESTSTISDPATLQPPDKKSDNHIPNLELESEIAGRPPNNTEDNLDKLDLVAIMSEKERSRPKHTKPSIIERFAYSQGFQKDGENRFFHADGGWIAKTNGDRFLWERRTAKGEIVRYYWPKDHCLEQEPLQLEADIWGLIDKFPENYALIISNSQGDPVEVSGKRLRVMLADGVITLYPAAYRLVYSHERE